MESHGLLFLQWCWWCFGLEGVLAVVVVVAVVDWGDVFLGLEFCPGTPERVEYVDTPYWRSLSFYRTSGTFWWWRGGRWLMLRVGGFSWYKSLWPFIKSVEICRTLRVAEGCSSLLRLAGLWCWAELDCIRRWLSILWLLEFLIFWLSELFSGSDGPSNFNSSSEVRAKWCLLGSGRGFLWGFSESLLVYWCMSGLGCLFWYW